MRLSNTVRVAAAGLMLTMAGPGCSDDARNGRARALPEDGLTIRDGMHDALGGDGSGQDTDGPDFVNDEGGDWGPSVDGGVADTAVADTAVADTAVADTAVADTAVADTAVADTAVADTAVADTAVADTAVADTAVADTGGADTTGAECPEPAREDVEALGADVFDAIRAMVTAALAASETGMENPPGLDMTKTTFGLSFDATCTDRGDQNQAGPSFTTTDGRKFGAAARLGYGYFQDAPGAYNPTNPNCTTHPFSFDVSLVQQGQDGGQINRLVVSTSGSNPEDFVAIAFVNPNAEVDEVYNASLRLDQDKVSATVIRKGKAPESTFGMHTETFYAVACSIRKLMGVYGFVDLANEF